MERTAVKHNVYDEREWGKYVDPKEAGEEFVRNLVSGKQQLATYGDLVEDAFYSLYKFRPELNEVKAMASPQRVNHTLMQRAMESPLYQKLRSSTRGDADVSAVASMAMASTLLEKLPEGLKKQVNEATRQAEAGDEGEAEAGDGAEEPSGNQQEGGGGAEADGDGAPEPDPLADAIEGNSTAIDAALKEALDQAMDDVEEQQSLVKTWGNNLGADKKVPFRKRLEYAKRMGANRKFQQIADLLGRYKPMALQKLEERTEDVTNEVVGIETGRNLQLLAPQSLMALADPDLEILFDKNYVESQLLQYKVEGKERNGRGPVVVCWDESGSMQGFREAWAKAVALALMAVAYKQKRHWYGIAFSSTGQVRVSKVDGSESQEKYLETAISVAEHFFCAGTDYVTPLTEALAAIGVREELKKADLVFVTDDECGVPAEFLAKYHEAKKRMQFTAVGVFMGYGSAPVLQTFCDQVLPFEAWQSVGDRDANHIFQKVAS